MIPRSSSKGLSSLPRNSWLLCWAPCNFLEQDTTYGIIEIFWKHLITHWRKEMKGSVFLFLNQVQVFVFFFGATTFSFSLWLFFCLPKKGVWIFWNPFFPNSQPPPVSDYMTRSSCVPYNEKPWLSWIIHFYNYVA